MPSSPRVDLPHLTSLLGPLACRFDIEALAICASTNDLLATRINAPSGSLIVADQQLAGRGRRGRSWISDGESSLTFSLLWRFSRSPAAMAGLSLAVGVALARALEPLANGRVALKWPNDLLRPVDEGWGKIGGILIDLIGEPARSSAVIGIGLNLCVPSATITAGFPAAGLAQSTDAAPDRHLVLAAALIELVAVLDQFDAAGLSPLIDEWQQRNAFAGCEVRIEENGRVEDQGVCQGIDIDGALLVGSGNRSRRWLSGDVTLRPA